MTPIRVFWWNERRNFGDLLTEQILRWAGIPIVWAPPDEAELFGVGSILEKVPARSRALVFGTGLMYESSRVQCRADSVLAVRGPLTAERIGVSIQDVVVADPGILVPRSLPRNRCCAEIGIVPHYVDKDDRRLRHLCERNRSAVRLIDVEQPDASRVATEIASCEFVLSSSLHGLAVAWGAGIPCAWLQLSEDVLGAGFKFRDFYGAFGSVARPHTLTGEETVMDLRQLCQTPPTAVSECKEKLMILGGTLLERIEANRSR